MDDARLLDRACKGDEDAFTWLFDTHQRAIYRYATRMCGADAGDDVVQDTFLAVLRSPGRYDPARGGVASYLFGIARHIILKRLAASYGAAAVEGLDTELPANGDTPHETLAKAQDIDAVRAAVNQLPIVYREAIVLCDLEEQEYAAAAAIIGCPIGTVRSRLHRARALLTTRLTCKTA